MSRPEVSYGWSKNESPRMHFVNWGKQNTGTWQVDPIELKAPVLLRPQNKSEKPIFRTNPRLEAPPLPFFLRTTFRNYAVTPASPLIKKSTALRSSLWCSHCSLAKRQQFSCPLGTSTLSLKLENVVPGCWICFFLVLWPSVFFADPPSMSSTRTYEYFF